VCEARVALVVLVSGTAGCIWGRRGKVGLHGCLMRGGRDLVRRWVVALLEGRWEAGGEHGLSAVKGLLHAERGRDVETGERLPHERMSSHRVLSARAQSQQCKTKSPHASVDVDQRTDLPRQKKVAAVRDKASRLYPRVLHFKPKMYHT